MAAIDLSCRELVELVTDYLEGVLPAAERARFEAHLLGCEGCEWSLEQIRTTVELTGRTRALEARPEMASLLEAFRGYRRLPDLYGRASATLLASWEAIARGSRGATVRRLDGVAAAVFPVAPERSVYNNALLDRDLDAVRRVRAVDAMEAAYASAGVERFAAWVHETDAPMQAELAGRGYTVAESTRAMAMSLADTVPPPAAASHAVAPLSWPDYVHHLETLGLPPGLLAGTDPAAFQVLAARVGGEPAATAIAFDHDGDCGVFNVSTLAPLRRRGLGTTITACLLRDAAARGCTTASLQATPMAERVYAAVGFRDLGRILEFVPC
jgi:hypothetical protein